MLVGPIGYFTAHRGRHIAHGKHDNEARRYFKVNMEHSLVTHFLSGVIRSHKQVAFQQLQKRCYTEKLLIFRLLRHGLQIFIQVE